MHSEIGIEDYEDGGYLHAEAAVLTRSHHNKPPYLRIDEFAKLRVPHKASRKTSLFWKRSYHWRHYSGIVLALTPSGFSPMHLEDLPTVSAHCKVSGSW